MGKYKKKPVVVEAVQFTGDNWAEIHAFTGHREPRDGLVMDVFAPNGKPVLWVEANQAWLVIEVGEWVIKDTLGFCPCAEDVFVATYEEVTDGSVDSVGQ